MRQCPELLIASSCLETPAGRYVSCGAISIAPSAGLVLVVGGHNDLAIKTISMGIVFQAAVIAGSFWKGGKSLIAAIDASLRQHKRQQQMVRTIMTTMTTTKTTATGEGNGTERGGSAKDVVAPQQAGDSSNNNSYNDSGSRTYGGEDESLLGARRKVKRMTFFAVQLAAGVFSMLLFSVYTVYGTAAPLPLMVVPMALVPLVWIMVNIQLHTGRSEERGGRLSRRRLVVGSGLHNTRRTSMFKTTISRRASSIYCTFSGKATVVPTEDPPI